MVPLNFIYDYIERMAELIKIEEDYYSDGKFCFLSRLIGDIGGFASLLWGLSALADKPNWRSIIGAGLAYGLSGVFKFGATGWAAKREGGTAVISSLKTILGKLDESKAPTLSLKEYCNPCGATCCRHSEAYGAPIVSAEEKAVIYDFIRREYGTKTDLFKRIPQKSSDSLTHYFVVREEKGRCIALDERNNCTIQEAKPLDCLIYPIKAVYDGNDKVLVIDTQCPASPHLSPEFIEAASSLAMKSIGMFSQEAYQHWMANNISWVQPGRARRLEEWLKER